VQQDRQELEARDHLTAGRAIVAQLVDWLYELSIDLFPEDGCLRVYGIEEDAVTAFTRDGIEYLKQIIADRRAAGNPPPELKSSE
jgi:hypothetical protein